MFSLRRAFQWQNLKYERKLKVNYLQSEVDMKKRLTQSIFKLTKIEAWKWKLLFINFIKYNKFSFNLNSMKYWDSKLNGVGNYWRNENYYHLLEFFPKNKVFTLLDIGCALGDGCELLKEKLPKSKITGIDISKVGIDKAKEKGKKIEYYVSDILKDPILKSFDYITIIQTLEHIDNPFAVVDKCLKCTKKALLISVPYNSKYTGPINQRDINEHRYSFNEKTFRNYSVRNIKITDIVEVSRSKCIIYEILPV